ncbi:hypothetical protein [Chitinophaga flava]|uniref:DUF1574 domain-containing protein n=1 Tax=Chitinophaga flava TaxID=2259036 RepID=A0A365Y2V2_9BACT|nr:hypothetical protein [Chitinophaga flava]RBL92906.1 hypothetical protein DF182_10105 [Chitinophaga flava]
MIRKSLLVFIVIFAAFNIYLTVSKKQFNEYQYQYQLNVIRAQKYIYDAERKPSAVMLGTSLSALMHLPDSIYNLSLPGLNVADGIEVVRTIHTLPKTVFIESNYFFRDGSESFKDIFSNRINNQLKIWLPGMRDQNQPPNILLSVLKPQKNKEERPAPENDAVPSPALFANLLTRQESIYKTVDTLLVNRGLDRLTEFVKDITASGGKVCIFEVPVSASLVPLPLTTVIREKLRVRFQHLENVYFLNAPKDHKYQTVDGIHLSHSSLWDYSMYFREETARLFSAKNELVP